MHHRFQAEDLRAQVAEVDVLELPVEADGRGFRVPPGA